MIRIQQHFSKQLSRGDDTAGRNGIPRCRVFAIGSGTQHLKSFVGSALPVCDPRRYHLAIVLNL
jgi:hypothetical protein